MKKGWKTKTLEEACQFSNGLWKGEKPPFVNVGVIRNTNFTKEGTLDDSDIAYLDVEAKKLEKRRLQFGDIILEKSGGGPKQPVGRVALFDKDEGDFSFSNFTAALRVLEPDDLDFRFLHKFLHWTYVSGVTEGMQSNSTGIRNLDGDAYKAIEITYPPLAEQQRIVGLLDEAFEGLATAKANAEKNLQNARALFESHLQTVFAKRGGGWEDKRLGDVCRTGAGGTPLKSKKEYYEGGNIPWLMSGEVSQGEVLSATRFITQKGLENSSARLFPKDTVLVAMYGATAGEVGILRFEATTNQAVCGILPNAKFVPEFIFYALLSKKRELIDQATGNAQPNISQIKIKNTMILVTSLDEQRQTVSALAAFSTESQRLVRLYERKLAALEALKKSLLHQAFSGEL